ncbi:MAG: hypothetical protein ACOCX0_02270 [Bacteroidota bacterium]
MNNKEIRKANPEEKKEITRREALQKMGYAAFASSTMFLLLNNPTKVYANSEVIPEPDPDPFNVGGGGGTKNNQQNDDPWKNDEDPWK